MPPEFAARCQVVAEHEPAVHARRGLPHALAEVEALGRRPLIPLSNHRAEKHLAIDHDRRGPAPAGHLSGPGDMLCRAPGLRQAGRVVGHTAAIVAAKPCRALRRDTGPSRIHQKPEHDHTRPPPQACPHTIGCNVQERPAQHQKGSCRVRKHPRITSVSVAHPAV